MPLSATWKKKYMELARMPGQAACAADGAPGPPARARQISLSQQGHVGLVEVLLGVGVNLDMRTFRVELDLKHLAVGPPRHDHVFLGHRVVPVASEYRSLEVLHQPFELGNVLEGCSNFLRLGAVTLDRTFE